ncbi:MAG: hypothetical protein IJ751_01550, partial [Oscillospiraceae bacterium]|nr:hypothetical protein [Oscillospiraceae bacterium]
ELCALGTDGSWLRMAGTAVFDDPDAAQAQAARAKARTGDGSGPDLKQIYRDGMPPMHLFSLRDADARIYRHGEGILYRVTF